MIKRKLLAIISLCIIGGLPNAMVGMNAAERAEQMIGDIGAQRATINEQRAAISKACWTGSALLSIGAGFAAGWYGYKHNSLASRLFRSYAPHASALISGTGLALLNLGASWLTKHWGMYHFFTHRGQIQVAKNQLKIILIHEGNDRAAQYENCHTSLSAISNLDTRIQQDQNDIAQLQTSRRTNELQETAKKETFLYKTHQLSEQLHHHVVQIQQREAILHQHVEPDQALQELSKGELEQRLMTIIGSAHGNFEQTQWIVTQWIPLQQIILALEAKVHTQANNGHPHAELAQATQNALYLILKLALETNNASLCSSLAHCDLKLHKLCPFVTPRFFNDLRITNDLIAPFANDDDEDGGKCPICLEDYDNQRQGIILACGHILCFQCRQALIDQAFARGSSATCPLCRKRTV